MFAYWHSTLSASGYVCCCPVWSRFRQVWHTVKDQLRGDAAFSDKCHPWGRIVVCQSIQSPECTVMSLTLAIIATYLYHLPTVWHPVMRWLDCMPPMGGTGLCSGLRAIMRLLKSELTLHSSLFWFHFATSPWRVEWHYFNGLLLLEFCTYPKVLFTFCIVVAVMDLTTWLSCADRKKR